MIATLTEPHITTDLVSRPAPEGACLSLEEITSQAAERLPDTRKRRLERVTGLTQLLAWLRTFPGDDWSDGKQQDAIRRECYGGNKDLSRTGSPCREVP